VRVSSGGVSNVCSGFRAFEFRASDECRRSWFVGAWVLGFRVEGFGLRVPGFGFRVCQGFGFRVYVVDCGGAQG